MRLSDTIKLELLKYFRFERNYNLICTEGIHQADVNASNGSSLVEVEIKISKADLKKEFQTAKESSRWKEYKHKNYSEPSKHMPTFIVPNRFYFCVPAELADWAVEYLKDKNSKYGLLSYDTERYTGSTHIVTIKPARNLHNEKPEMRALLLIARRTTNELITAKEKFIENKQELEALQEGVLVAEGIK